MLPCTQLNIHTLTHTHITTPHTVFTENTSMYILWVSDVFQSSLQGDQVTGESIKAVYSVKFSFLFLFLLCHDVCLALLPWPWTITEQPSVLCSTSPWTILKNIHEGGHARSQNWKRDWSQWWTRTWWGHEVKNEVGMCKNGIQPHFQSHDPPWLISVKWIQVNTLPNQAFDFVISLKMA